MSFFTDATAVFPNNAIELISLRLTALYGSDLLVKKRKLRHTDNTQSVGIYPINWMPDDNSFEFQSREPTLQRYIIGVQSFCKESEEEKGIAIHSVMSKTLRSLLYNDTPLALGLNALSVTMNGFTERIQRRGVVRQRYLDSEIDGKFLYLSMLEYYIETENK